MLVWNKTVCVRARRFGLTFFRLRYKTHLMHDHDPLRTATPRTTATGAHYESNSVGRRSGNSIRSDIVNHFNGSSIFCLLQGCSFWGGGVTEFDFGMFDRNDIVCFS